MTHAAAATHDVAMNRSCAAQRRRIRSPIPQMCRTMSRRRFGGLTVLADCGAAAPAPAVANTSPPSSPSYTAQLRGGLAHIWGIASLRARAGALRNVHVPPRPSELRQPPTNQRKRERSSVTSDHHGALRRGRRHRRPVSDSDHLRVARRSSPRLAPVLGLGRGHLQNLHLERRQRRCRHQARPSTNSTPTSTAWSPSGAATSPTT